MLYLCSEAGRTWHLSELSPRVAFPAQTRGYCVRVRVAVGVKRRRPILAILLHPSPTRSTLPLAGVRRQSSVHRSAATLVRVVGCRWSVVVGTSLQYNSILGSSIVHISCQSSGRRRSPGGSVRLSVRLSTNYRLSAVLLGWTRICPTRAIARTSQQRRAQRC